jgi:hypothetical protein
MESRGGSKSALGDFSYNGPCEVSVSGDSLAVKNENGATAGVVARRH